jgi:sigma-54 dependent transcriptional regulator, acetoin dehydrogenase operon transcriptional activator AcoR
VEEKTHPYTMTRSIPSVSQQSLIRAWEHFVESGAFGRELPRAVIARSWERSRERGVDPLAERAPTVMSAEEIEACLARDDLGQAGQNILDGLAQTVAGTRHVIVLADADGRILYSVGHRDVQSHLERINFQPGGAWSEDDVGPNGIGTPLALGRPELVLGSEHYCQGWQPWVCYGAPILDPFGSGRPVGMVDITGPVENVSQEVMALVCSIAQSVRTSLSVVQYRRREQLRAIARERSSRWLDEAVIVVDMDGYIVDANTRANRDLERDCTDLFDKPVSNFLPGVWQTIEQNLEAGNEGDLSVNMRTSGGSLRSFRCRIEPLTSKKAAGSRQWLGALLILDMNGSSCRPQRSPAMPTGRRHQYRFDNILGESPAIRSALRLAIASARDPLQSSVLLIGETGTGKELLAHAIHAESSRANGPFVAINCGALPRDLIESELFGYAPGAFTGASRQGLPGKFELAHGGTLFLDEIDSMPQDLQSRFLRVLDDHQVTRLGSVRSTTVDVRIIAAATPELPLALAAGRFRQDLYHRLCVLEVPVPPLRDRGHDVVLLAESILARESITAGRRPPKIGTAARAFLLNHDWPGNIRELRNLCIRWLLGCGDSVDAADLPALPGGHGSAQPCRKTAGKLRRVEDELIRNTLAETGGNLSAAARRLGIDRSTLYRRLKRRQLKS